MYFNYANVLVFFLFGIAFVILNISVLSRIMRPTVKQKDKEAIYECGEPVIGSSWVRYDMRFYSVALIFLVFDVEVAFLYPWAVVFQNLKAAGQQAGIFVFIEMLIFVAILVVGFVYVWVRGDLEWVKSLPSTSGDTAGSTSGSGDSPGKRAQLQHEQGT